MTCFCKLSHYYHSDFKQYVCIVLPLGESEELFLHFKAKYNIVFLLVIVFFMHIRIVVDDFQK